MRNTPHTAMTRWYVVAERIVLPRDTPVDTNVYQADIRTPVADHEDCGQRQPPERPATTMALPTESHQIQKYGLAALVRSPASYGLVTAPSGVVSRDAFLLPAIVRTPKTTSAMPPTTAMSASYGRATVIRPRTINRKMKTFDNHVPEKIFRRLPSSR